MRDATLLPVPTAAQTRQGRQLYTRLGMVVQSYQDWFAEGVPQEWAQALDTIQRLLTECKREAAKAVQEDKTMPAQAELFAARQAGKEEG